MRNWPGSSGSLFRTDFRGSRYQLVTTSGTGYSEARYGALVDLFAEIADERRELADTLDGLTPDQWQVQSLCDTWTVHDVAAHVLMPLVTSTPKVIAVMARHLMNWDKANLVLTASVATRTNPEIISGLRERCESHFTPPGLGAEAPLTDVIVHGQDIRRPLGIQRSIPADRQLVILNFLTNPKASRGFVPKELLADIQLKADDLDWGFGQGELVEGPAEALMMTIAGRGVAAADLSGGGVQTLAERLASQ